MNKTISLHSLQKIETVSDNQFNAFQYWKDGYNLNLIGSAGTGKTFLAMYFALDELRKKNHEKIIILRSAVPTRDIGYLKGTYEEKIDQYSKPYQSIAAQLFNRKDAYDMLRERGLLIFETTSYLRGDTFDDSCIIVDEIENMTFHELDSVITRIGENTRVMFVGDGNQSDLRQQKDRNGMFAFLEILNEMPDEFATVEFNWEDIVRSDLVRKYIMTKESMESNSVSN